MASRGINKVILIGNLGADPEVRFTQNSTAIANLSVATSETWKDKQSGEQREQTEWHRVVLYRRLAEVAGEYLRKGSKVYIEGRLQTRKWQGQDGRDMYTTEVIANDMQMLDSAGANQGAGGFGGQSSQGNDSWHANSQASGQQPAESHAGNQQGFQGGTNAKWPNPREGGGHP